MKTSTIKIGVAALVFVLVLPLATHAQGRPTGGGGATSSGSTSSSGGGATASGSSRGFSGGVSSSGGYYAPSRGDVGASYSGGSFRGAPPFTPYSSFNNFNYYRWLNYNNWLYNNFNWFQLMQLGYFDTGRFYRNREPLVTPLMVKSTLAVPLAASERLLANVDELQALIDDMQAGKPVSKEQIEAKTDAIRELAKKIRSYEPVAYVDPGKKEDLTKGIDNNIGVGAISKLREMAVALNSQLKTMAEQKVTSTISVNTFNQPSFESLSKGIEKLSKTIGNAKVRS